MRTFATILPAIATTLLAAAPAAADTSGITSEIPFTGFLQAGKKPANGTHDLQFLLYDAPTSGTQVGTPSSAFGVPIKKGQYSTTLDFGPGVWTGAPRWVEVQYRKGNATSYTISPTRIQVLAVPYAHTAAHAATAGTITGPVNATHAQTADYATEAGHAATSTNASHAESADYATTAGVALSSNGLPAGARVLITTGSLPQGFSLAGGAVYDPGLWQVLPSTVAARSGSAFCSANGKLYRLGGDTPVATGEVYSYDPQSGLWEPKASMLTVRHGSVRRSVAVVGTRIFVLGGDPTPNKNESYDTETNSWTTNANLPVNMAPVYAVAVGTDIHLFSDHATHYIYHTATNSYSNRPRTESLNSQDSAVAMGGTIYMARSGALMAYDAGTGEVTKVHNYAAASSTSAERGLAFSGNSLFLLTSDIGTFYEYPIAEDRWINRQYPRFSASGYLAECNGDLYTLGTGSNDSPSLERFVPGSDHYLIQKQ